MRTFLISVFILTIIGSSFAEQWIDVKQNDNIEINGLSWLTDNGREFLRLPLKRKNEIPETAWTMSKCPSGARVRFKTDSTSLKIKLKHGMKDQDSISTWHMSAAMVSGIDLYIGKPSKPDFWGVSKPEDAVGEYQYTYFEGFTPTRREFMLCLPAYIELYELYIGIDDNAEISKPTSYGIQKPVVFYGTSITQGACATRGSNNYVSIVGRELNVDTVNLGFSGSGCGEPVMAEMMSQIDASVYVVDSVANMNSEIMKKRYENFITILRKRKPEIPVVLMTKPHFANEILKQNSDYYTIQHKPLFATYRKFREKGDKNIFLFDTGKIIKPGRNHPSVDGIHLTDTGFMKIASELKILLSEILK
jgi:hypothetical protein